MLLRKTVIFLSQKTLFAKPVKPIVRQINLGDILLNNYLINSIRIFVKLHTHQSEIEKTK